MTTNFRLVAAFLPRRRVLAHGLGKIALETVETLPSQKETSFGKPSFLRGELLNFAGVRIVTPPLQLPFSSIIMA